MKLNFDINRSAHLVQQIPVSNRTIWQIPARVTRTAMIIRVIITRQTVVAVRIVNTIFGLRLFMRLLVRIYHSVMIQRRQIIPIRSRIGRPIGSRSELLWLLLLLMIPLDLLLTRTRRMVGMMIMSGCRCSRGRVGRIGMTLSLHDVAFVERQGELGVLGLEMDPLGRAEQVDAVGLHEPHAFVLEPFVAQLVGLDQDGYDRRSIQTILHEQQASGSKSAQLVLVRHLHHVLHVRVVDAVRVARVQVA